MTAAVLITYMNIPAPREAEFNDWYTNEHVAERVDLPGFKSAYRFEALDGAPKYFAYYETDDLGALTTPTYKAILADQTDWSKSVMADFQDFGRMCGPLVERSGRGHGGVALVVRAKGDDRLEGFLRDVMAAAQKEANVVGGYLWRGDAEATGDDAASGVRIMVIEALDEDTLRAVAAERLQPQALRAAGAEATTAVGFYRLISFMEK